MFEVCSYYFHFLMCIYLSGYFRYVHENGCSWNGNECAVAARQDVLECLIYAHENGCTWDELTCVAAADSGGLDCLMCVFKILILILIVLI
jgi:hypothetical protein